jgi:putative glutamine amidotransferase
MPSARRPLIGITCSTSAFDSQAKQPQDRLNEAYTRAVLEAGGLPVLLPNVEWKQAHGALLERLDGVLLSGGYDVHPCWFGEREVHVTAEIDQARDRSEMPLIQAAVESGRPLLAICRGIQTLNVAMGGTLVQDLPSERPSGIQHRQTEARHVETHAVEVAPDSRLGEIIGARRMGVNSFHHQAVKELAPGLRATAWAPDGLIEAVEGAGPRFMLGVQFHPEEMTGSSEGARRIFRSFVEACRDG